MSGGFFRGTSADQDTRFSNKQAKLLKSQKFAPELDHLVDMTKVKMDVIRPWIANRVTQLLDFEDEVLINFIYGLVDGKEVDGKQIQIQLTGFMEKNTGKFMKELWGLLLSAQKNASGIPQQFLDAKEEELRKKKEEADRITNEIQKKREKEGRESELEKQKGGEADSDGIPNKPSTEFSNQERDADGRHGFRGENRTIKSPHLSGRRMSPHGSSPSPARSGSKSFSRSRSYSGDGRRSRSLSESPLPLQCSVSPDRRNQARRRSRSPKRSISPRRRHSPRRPQSPLPRRKSPYSRRRSLSPSRRRSPSPRRHRSPRLPRRRSPSPYRRRSPSPLRRRSPALRRKMPSPQWRSPTPPRRRAISPLRRSPLPRSPEHRRRSPAPRSPDHRRRSPAPRSPDHRRRSPAPRSPDPRRRSPAPRSPDHRRRSPAPRSPGHRRRSPMHLPRKHDSRHVPPRSRSPERSPESLHQRHRSMSREDNHSNGVNSPNQDDQVPQRPQIKEVEHSNSGRKDRESHMLSTSLRSPQRDLRAQIDGRHKGLILQSSSTEKSRSSPEPAQQKVLSTKLSGHESRDISLSPRRQPRGGLGCHGTPETKRKEVDNRHREKTSTKMDFREGQKKHFLIREVEYGPGRVENERPLEEVHEQAHLKRLSAKDEYRVEQKESTRSSSDDHSDRDHKINYGQKSSKGNVENYQVNTVGLDSNNDGVFHGEKRKRNKTDDHIDDNDRKEAKRRRKEEKKLRKEEKRRRREEKHRRREERRASKLRTIHVDTATPPSDFEKNDSDAGFSYDKKTSTKRDHHPSDSEGTESEQKKLEIELRKKALESLRAKKAVSH